MVWTSAGCKFYLALCDQALDLPSQLNLDGSLQVVLPHDEVIVVLLSRVSLFRDMDDMAWDLGAVLDPGELLDEGSGGSWEDIDEADQRDDWGHIDEEPLTEVDLSASPFTHHAEMPGTFRLTPSPEPPESEHSSQSNSSQVATSPSPPAASQTLLSSPSSPRIIDPASTITTPFAEEASKALGLLNTESRLQLDVANVTEVEERWKKFAFLPSVPPDHAFFDTPVAQPSKTFMTRLNKEYRVLGSSLPGISLIAQDLDRILTPPQIQY
jgi:ubiquitin-conjugating enzyme E2 O